MINNLGWILFGIIVLWHFHSLSHNQKKRNHLGCYIIYLLLNDEIRGDHKKKFGDWIKDSDISHATKLTLNALFAIEKMANTSDILTASGMVWNSEYASHLREKSKAE